jgi:hypothetical protein
MWNATLMLIIVKLSYCYSNYETTETIPSVISSVQRYFFSDCIFMLHIQGNAGNFTLRMISILHYLLGWKFDPYCTKMFSALGDIYQSLSSIMYYYVISKGIFIDIFKTISHIL